MSERKYKEPAPRPSIKQSVEKSRPALPPPRSFPQHEQRRPEPPPYAETPAAIMRALTTSLTAHSQEEDEAMAYDLMIQDAVEVVTSSEATQYYLDLRQDKAEKYIELLDTLEERCQQLLIDGGVDRSDIDQLPTATIRFYDYVKAQQRFPHLGAAVPNGCFVIQLLGNTEGMSKSQRHNFRSNLITQVRGLEDDHFSVVDITEHPDKITNFTMMFAVLV